MQRFHRAGEPVNQAASGHVAVQRKNAVKVYKLLFNEIQFKTFIKQKVHSTLHYVTEVEPIRDPSAS